MEKFDPEEFVELAKSKGLILNLDDEVEINAKVYYFSIESGSILTNFKVSRYLDEKKNDEMEEDSSNVYIHDSERETKYGIHYKSYEELIDGIINFKED